MGKQCVRTSDAQTCEPMFKSPTPTKKPGKSQMYLKPECGVETDGSKKQAGQIAQAKEEVCWAGQHTSLIVAQQRQAASYL